MIIPQITKELDFDLFKKGLEKLDPALRELVSGEIGGDLIEKIAVKYGFDSYNLPDLMMLFGLYLTKMITPQVFLDYLATLVPLKYFPQFLQELEDKIWSPYDSYLNKVGVVYKQLTKLTPQSVISDSAQLRQDGVQSDKQSSVISQEPGEVLIAPEIEKPQQIQDLGLKIEEAQKPESEIKNQESKINVSVIEPPISPASTPVIITDLPNAPKPEQSVPVPPQVNFPEKAFGPSAASVKEGEARVKFDIPKINSQSTEPVESFISPKASEVKFAAPEAQPELAQGFATKEEEKKIEIPKALDVQKTNVQGRQVIDLTNFGLSNPDKD
ncbi:MAG: hypothetical protein UW85_C0008G0025 [Parcubacteria group bacterium GW2011_GWA1_Parcubacteria_45_10]|nr:MAG: hypothetical protein UW85_C0008G0025 [Parcubacteria group bacterium GW2011_GWA1_Parcubacteria_45_10]